MKRMMIRILSLGLALLLISGAAAESTDDLSFTMSEKMAKQLNAGSGFIGTLTLTAAAVEGREDEAFSTVKPITMDWSYIKVRGGEQAPGEVRLKLSLNASEYQQGSAELSLQDGAVYLQSSLLDDGWYLLGDQSLQPVLQEPGITGALPSVLGLLQVGNIMPGTASFFENMASYLIGGSGGDLSGAMEQYTTKIDFWLEGYRGRVEIKDLEDGTSAMVIEYRIPPAAVKAQLKQLLIDLMNDEALLDELSSLMPKAQSDQFLTPSLQPYYFYAVDELPLEDDLTVYRVMSLLGETVELSVAMPLYDSEAGPMTLLYTRKLGGEDMPYENTLSLTGEGSYAGLNYRKYETITGATVYQGTLRVEGAEVDGVKPQTLWASFDLSSQTATTKDLNGYETLKQSLKLSLEPAEIADTENAAQYAVFAKTELTLDASFASLAARNAPTDMNLTLTIGGEEMAQSITMVISGTTTGLWTPEAFDAGQAVNLVEMPSDEQQSLLSRAVVKAGLLFLPYINLPKIATDTAP